MKQNRTFIFVLELIFLVLSCHFKMLICLVEALNIPSVPTHSGKPGKLLAYFQSCPGKQNFVRENISPPCFAAICGLNIDDTLRSK